MRVFQIPFAKANHTASTIPNRNGLLTHGVESKILTPAPIHPPWAVVATMTTMIPILIYNKRNNQPKRK